MAKVSIKKINKLLSKAFEGKVEAAMQEEHILLTGELERWSDVVRAVLYVAGEVDDVSIVNDIDCTVDKPLPVRKPYILDSQLEFEEPDVLIIGGGIIGCAIARELSRYALSILIVEKEHDLAMQATGHSYGLVHSGANLRRGTLKHWYTKLGNEKMEKVCEELNVPFKRTGQYLLNTRRIFPILLKLKKLYLQYIHRHKDIQIVKGTELHQKEPGIIGKISSAFYFPTGGVVDPQMLAIAYAENAVQNGATVSFDTMVQEMTVEEGVIVSVKTNRGTIHPRFVVNASGLFGESIAYKAKDRFFSIRPVKHSGIIIDKKHADSLVNSAVSVQAKPAKGLRRFSENLNNIHRTVHGSVIIGTSLMETMNTEDYSTDRFCTDFVLKAFSRFIPSINKKQILKYFSGISASTFDGDFIISEGRAVSNIVHATGIHFPGITAAPAIAEDVAGMVAAKFESRGTLRPNTEFNPTRRATFDTSEMEEGTLQSLIENNSDYGIVVCHCENVSKGEIIDAINRVIPCQSIDAVRRRTHAGCGSCQGQCCTPQTLRLIAIDKHLAQQEVHKCGVGSEMVYGTIAVYVEEDKPDKEQQKPADSYRSDVYDITDSEIVKKLADLGL